MMNLSNSIIESVTRQMTLSLCEPRMLVNMSVCYYADDKTSQSDKYKDGVKNMLNEYANRVAETSDGHVLIDQVVLFSTADRLAFYDTDNFPPWRKSASKQRSKMTGQEGLMFKFIQMHTPLVSLAMVHMSLVMVVMIPSTSQI